MTTLRCIVVDDEPLARDLIAAYVERTPFMTLAGKFPSAQDAVPALMEGGIDVAFLDIQIPRMSGMELARLVTPECRVVFITAYDKYAVEGFRVNALDYLMKPVSYDEFLTTARKALQWVEMAKGAQHQAAEQPDHLLVKSDYKLVRIAIADITFIEGVKDYVKIYTDPAASPVLTQMSLKALEEKLPEVFMRVHRSFIVNTAAIRLIERNRIVMGSHYIPVGDTYKSAFADWLASRTITL